MSKQLANPSEMLSRSKSVGFEVVKQGAKEGHYKTLESENDSDSDVEVGHLGKFDRKLPKLTSCMELSTKFSLPQIDISPTISTDNLIDEGSNESETNESRTHLNRNSQSKPMPKATTVCFSDLFSSICESNSSGSDSQEDGHLTMTTKFTKRKLRPTRCQSSQNLRTSYYQVCSQLDLQSPTEEMDNHQRMLNIPARLTHRYTQS